MNTQESYNSWASQYDTNENKTRDLEGQAIRDTLSDIPFSTVLEVGCGTGKNTSFLLGKADYIAAVDLSEEMMAKAKAKIDSSHVEFFRADINGDWNFTDKTFDLIGFSLVLEHVQNLDHIFKEVYKKLNNGGHVYIGELHPFKQYTGSKARFETADGVQIVPCYNHHVSDFVHSAKKYGLQLVDLDEYFDHNDQSGIPRILVLLLKKGPAI